MNPTPPGDPPFGFEPVEHTADLGLHAWGRTLEELVEQAGEGMVSLLVDPASVRAKDRRQVVLAASDIEEGLIALLQEILYLYEVGRFAPAGLRVVRAAPDSITAEILGEPFDPSRHGTRTDIKAATYHDLRIRQTWGPNGGVRYETVVIFDI